ncbi:pullulanase X25 domain-containing protein [Flammeovirga agarivorans]|uniref:T9SS type A sorting domain-containing protein n=1 Tax=Flammeovirga agarivorans TaxID=2726742 RepID=A0A7X8XVR9_9BACT|nr:T9SS type A sorting domain-containing protein [Flammeovirga agarivorans]NLR91534.1 T9SS type A sorting domain-containing protein [Flammeovirga agarivorans]
MEHTYSIRWKRWILSLSILFIPFLLSAQYTNYTPSGNLMGGQTSINGDYQNTSSVGGNNLATQGNGYTNGDVFMDVMATSGDTTNLPQPINLEVTIDMRWAIAQGIFDPSSDTLDIAGSMNEWAGGDLLSDNGDSTYTVAFMGLPDTYYEYKIRINQSWDTSELGQRNNRFVSLEEGDNAVYIYYDNEDLTNPALTFNLDGTLLVELGLLEDGATPLVILETMEGRVQYHMTDLGDSQYTATSYQLTADDDVWYYYKAGSTQEFYLRERAFPQANQFDDTFDFTELSLKTLFLSLDMNVEIENGRFNPDEDFVDIAGDFNDWQGDELSDDDMDGIYTLEKSFFGDSTFFMKARINGSWELGSHEFRGDTSRFYTMGEEDSLAISIAYNDENGAYPITYFYSDMRKQIQDGNFDPEADVPTLQIFRNDLILNEYIMHPTEEEGVYMAQSQVFDEGEEYMHRFNYIKNIDTSHERFIEGFNSYHIVTAEDNFERRWFNYDINTFTFYVDMRAPMMKGEFNPNEDEVDIAGTFNNWGVDSVWTLLDYEDDSIYVYTAAGFPFGEHEFKARINQSWEQGEHELGEGPNRKISIQNDTATIRFAYNDEVITNPLTTFNVDLTKQVEDGNMFSPRNVDVMIYNPSDSGEVMLTHQFRLAESDDNIFTGSYYFKELNEQFLYKYRITEIGDSSRMVFEELDYRMDTVSSQANVINDLFNDSAFETTVTFAVDMNSEIEQNRFNASIDEVDIVGDFNLWGDEGSLVLSDDDADGIYTGMLYFRGGKDLEFKARKNESWASGDFEKMGDDNTREAMVTPGKNNVIEFTYNDELIEHPLATFEVDFEKLIHQDSIDFSTQHLGLMVYNGNQELQHVYLLDPKDDEVTFTATSKLKAVNETYYVQAVVAEKENDEIVISEDVLHVFNVSDTANVFSFSFNNETLVTSLAINVDMRWMLRNDQFDPSTDDLGFVSELANWGIDYDDQLLSDPEADSIYTLFVDSIPSLTFEYKLRLNNSWDFVEHDGVNRAITLNKGANTIDVVYGYEDVDHPETMIYVDMAKERIEGTFTDTTMLFLQVFEGNDVLKSYTLTHDDGFVYSTPSQVYAAGEDISFKLFYVDPTQTIVEETAKTNVTVSSPFEIYHSFNNIDYYTGLTFEVDMNALIDQGRFNPDVDKVDLAGDFNGWGGDAVYEMLDSNNDGVYTYELSIDNHEVATYNFKTRINASWDDLLHEYPGGGITRSVTTSPGETINSAFYFDDENADNTAVIFKVNMSRQVELGNFDPTVEGNEVRVRIFDGELFSSYPLTQDDNGLYSFFFQKFTDNEEYSYQLIYQYPDGDGWDVTTEDINRSFVKEESQQTISLWFNDELPEQRFDAVWLVNMQSAITFGDFDPNNDVLTMKGSFDNWDEEITLSKNDTSNVFTTSISLPESIIYYQLFVNGVAEAFVAQDNSDNRSHHLQDGNTVIDVIFNFEEVQQVADDAIEAVETDSGTVVIEVAVEAFEDLEGEVTYQVMLANGDPLPDWVIFDPETLTFTIDPSKLPSGTRVQDAISDLDIIILANDEEGKSVAVEVTLPTEEIISDITDTEDPEGPNSLEDDLLNQVKVYPNLVNQFTLVEVPNSVEITDLIISNAAGVKIDQIEIKGSMKLDMGKYPAGLYIMRLHVNDQYITRKIIKK